MTIRKEFIKDEKGLYNRRNFLKKIGLGTTSLAISQLTACRVMVREEGRQLGAPALYNEKYRPQFHFTPRTNWTNDPNGVT